MKFDNADHAATTKKISSTMTTASSTITTTTTTATTTTNVKTPYIIWTLALKDSFFIQNLLTIRNCPQLCRLPKLLPEMPRPFSDPFIHVHTDIWLFD